MEIPNPFEPLFQQMSKFQSELFKEIRELKREIKELREAQEEAEPSLTAKQLSKKIGYTPRTIYRMRDDGRIPEESPNRYKYSDVRKALNAEKASEQS